MRARGRLEVADLESHPPDADQPDLRRRAGLRATATRTVVEQGEATRGGRRRPRDQWKVLILDNHAGYIGWGDFQSHLRMLEENSAMRADRPEERPERRCAAVGPAACGRAAGRWSWVIAATGVTYRVTSVREAEWIAVRRRVSPWARSR